MKTYRKRLMSHGEDDKDSANAGDSGQKDEWLWRQVTRDVKPLSGSPEEDAAPERSPAAGKIGTAGKKSRSLENERIGSREDSSGPDRAGLDRRTEDRLRRGQMRLEAQLDLHGLTRSQAKEALESFLFQARDEGKRCVLVITGKGTRTSEEEDHHWMASGPPGVLKRRVPEWLDSAPLSPIVLRAVPAKPKHGGQGALYVLLRRKRSQGQT